MRLTRRGYAALAVAAGAFVFAWAGEPDRARALNAVAAPILAAIVAGAIGVRRAGAPAVERSEPNHGFPGETRSVELSVDGSGVAAITDEVGAGLSGSATFERTLPATDSYEIAYEERGVHELGPATVRITDVLGLVAETYRIDETTSALVYPRVYAAGDLDPVLRTLGPRNDERSEFDRLREYVPGDSLRDVHWKTSAKHDDLLVTEFSDPMDEEAVAIAASATAGHADEMATAAGTVLVAAVRSGLSVELAVPGGSIPEGRGETHQRRALELLARAGSGDVPDGALEDADVLIRADDAGVSVAVDGRRYSLDELTAARANPVLTEVGA